MKINVKGVIISNDLKWIYEYFDYESTSPGDVQKAIKDAMEGETIEVEVNSGGGDVFAGSEIYTALKAAKNNVKVSIVGLAASAASVIAMAGDHIEISPTAQVMIHNVSTVSRGDYRDMQHTADVIENANKSIANAYVLKTGLSQEELLELMDKETWLTAQQAKEKGFADSVMFDSSMQLVASGFNGSMIPKEVIEKMMNEKMNGEKVQENNIKLARARFNLLKLKGEV